jgi:hypothetical protein
MMIPTNSHVAWFNEQWRWTSGNLPSFGTTYPAEDKNFRESFSTQFYGRFQALQKEIKRGRKKVDTNAFLPALSQFLTTVYDFPENSSDMILNQTFFGVSRQFFKEAQAYDAGLKEEEIYQAMRNVWIMNGIQLMFDLPIELTPSIFAYSLLYPYSDNLLDDPALSKADKLLFSKRFEERLKGIPVEANDPREDKISQLVGMIENQFPRDEYPQVYESLLAIHAAQTRSIVLQKNNNGLTQEQILEICFDKGGASVLADGYLVAGKLTPLQQRFLFGYGIWLQLADDIQDIAEDQSEDVKTLFSSARQKSDVAVSMNRTFHFGRTIISDLGCFPSAICDDFGRLMVHSIELMIIQSAGLNPGHFSETYLNEMEEFSPLRFDYIRKMRKKGSSRRMGMVTSMVQI